MNKKVAIIIIFSLAMAVSVLTALIYIRDSCYYQMANVITTASFDSETCKASSRPVKFKIQNNSKYDLIQYGFTIVAYNKIDGKHVSHDAYTAHRLIPKGSGIEDCFTMPEINDVSLDDFKKNYLFKIKFFIVAFDSGNKKRKMCR